MGYQAQDLTGQKAPSIGGTFGNVGVDGKVKLSDMIPAGFDYSAEMLQVLDSTDAHAIAKYTYVTPEMDEEDFDGDGKAVGWWIKGCEGDDDEYRAGNVQVDVGAGFLGNFGKKKVNFTYSGQVVDGSTEIDLTGKKSPMIANFLPIDIKLGDIVVSGFDYSAEMLQVLDTGDAHATTKYTYVTPEMDEEDFDGDGKAVGWWIKGNEGDEEYRAKTVVWSAGQAMLGNFGKKKVKMVFPDPLTYSAK